MPRPFTSLLELFRSARAALADLPADVESYRALSERELLAANDECAAAERALAARRALIAGEIAHRSRPALGSRGLAQRTGHRTTENFLKQTAGISGAQALTAVRAGSLLVSFADEGRADEVTGEVFEPARSWMRPAASAITAGLISTAAAEVIESGLGSPNSAVQCASLESAVAELVREAVAGLDPDRLRRRARELRDELDLAGVALREAELRATRKLVHFEKPDGCGRAIWDMDPESYAAFKAVFDRATSPKRGGVRFVNERDAALATRIEADERTPGQLASDAFVQLMSLGADADSSVLLGTGAPIIRITVAEPSLQTRTGLGRIDGQSVAVSIPTVERLLCGADSIRAGFDPAGTVLDVEAEHRLFSKRQREILAAKFGGCMHPGCERPPSWTEAHHIEHWARDQGKTVIENGILLCKHHHLKYHNEGYEIARDEAGRYWLVPPPTFDPLQTPILMPLKSAALRDLWAPSLEVADTSEPVELERALDMVLA